MTSDILVISVSVLGIFAMYVFLRYKNYNDNEINKE